MKNLKLYTAVQSAILFTSVLLLTNSLFAQTDAKKETANASPTVSTQTVNAQQTGPWTVGIDPTKNTVQLSNSQANPLPVKLVGGELARKPFQARIVAGVDVGGALGSSFIPVPAGKRLVIENISAIARTPVGTKMQMHLFSYFDNNGDGVGDVSDISFHRISLTEQGTFVGNATATANHKVLIFADEQIGTGHYAVNLEIRLDMPATGFVQGQVTISGYLEDLPTAP